MEQQEAKEMEEQERLATCLVGCDHPRLQTAANMPYLEKLCIKIGREDLQTIVAEGVPRQIRGKS